MRTAARVGRRFQIDPMVVLNADRREWMIRLAAYNVTRHDDKVAADKNKPGRG